MTIDREKLRACSGLLAALLLSASLRAQEGTDFSGQWVLESPQPAGMEVPIALTIDESLARTNVRGEPMKPFFKDLTVVREFTGGVRRSDVYEIGGIAGTVPGGVIGGVGGTVPGGSPVAGSSTEPYTHTALRWEGRALIIETGSHTGRLPETGEWVERQEVWSIDSHGKLHIVLRTRSSAGPPRQVASAYHRK